MKKVFNTKDLARELKSIKLGDEILLYEKPIRSQQERLNFHKYLYELVLTLDNNDLDITGIVSFRKKV